MESRDIIARAKAVRTVTDGRVSSSRSKKYSARATGEEREERGEEDGGEGDDGDDSVTLSPYEKLQKGLFSWDRMRKRNKLGQGQGLEQGQVLGQGQGQGQVRGQGQGQGVDVKVPADGRGVDSSDGRSDNKGEKESQEHAVGGVWGMKEEGTETGTRRGAGAGAGAGADGAEWGTVEVTVGKITNWSKHLLPNALQASPSHTANLANTASPANPATGGGEAFLFCVLDPANTLGNEVRTYALLY